jgi:hypothetical protein
LNAFSVHAFTLTATTQVCGAAPEKHSLKLVCPQQTADGTAGTAVASVITAVTFASFGTPTGQCWGSEFNGRNSFVANSACNAPLSVKAVEQACLGKTSCTLEPVCAAKVGRGPQ